MLGGINMKRKLIKIVLILMLVLFILDAGQIINVVTGVKVFPGNIAYAETNISSVGITTGSNCTFMVMNDGTVKAWGSNQFGQLGIGNTNDRYNAPQTIPDLTGVKQIVSGGISSFALMNDGSVKSWGSNEFGKLGIPGDTIISTPQTIPGLSGVIQIAAGNSHTLALLSDGTVKAWGSNGSGQLGKAEYDYRWKCYNTPMTIPGLTGVSQIYASTYSSYALMNDGTVKAWGYNSGSALGINEYNSSYFTPVPTTITGLSGVKQISCGNQTVYALLNNGTVKAWGNNNCGQIGLGNTGSYISPVIIPSLEGVKQIVGGSSYCLALKNDGKVYSWGNNNYGELGQGNSSNTSQYLLPTEISCLSNVFALATSSCGSQHSFAIMNDGTIKGWGSNFCGEAGNCDGTNMILSPTKFYGLTYDKAPTLILNSPLNNQGVNSDVTLSISVIDPDNNILTCSYWLDSEAVPRETKMVTGNSTAQTLLFSKSKLSEGKHTIKFIADDGLFNSSCNVDIFVDRTAPIANPPKLVTNSTSQITVTASASDPISNGVSSGINSYLFNRNGNDIGTWQSSNSYTDSGLLPNTQYTYKYMARDNVMNTSVYSGSSSVYTLAQIPVLTNNGTTSNSINLGTLDNNPAGTKYQICTVDSNGNPKYYVTSTGTLSTTAQWITLTNKTMSVTGLSPNTTYTFKAKAMNGDGVITSECAPASATTKLAAPGNLTSTYTAPSDLKISWSPIQGASSYSVSDGSNTYTTQNTYYIPSGIVPGKKYTYHVSAVNGNVYSDSSTITIITPLASPSVTATATNTSITLHWDAITNATGYDITVGDISRSTTDTSITISGLEPNKTYTYSVRAKNDVITGAWSTPQNKMTRLTISGVPQNIKTAPSSNSINITWDAVDGATTYEVSADGKTISVGAATSYNDTGLEPGTQHNYQIRAINSGGKSAWSSSVTAKTTPLNPSVPANLKATAANKDITLTWDTVDKASGYEIEIDNPDQSVTGSLYIHSVTGTTYTPTGLASGSTHTYRIRSVIDGVQGPWSSAVSITTGTNPQGAPQNISTTISDTSATLMWDSVSSATSYDIEENGVVTGHVKGSISYKAIGLTPNTSYSFRIRAVNSAGKGDWSDPVTITTLSEPAMDVPGNIKAIPTSNSINLIWNPVDKATGYEIEIDGNTVKTVTNNMFTYADLHPETTYKFRVRAVNMGVPADWSGEVSTTTLSASEEIKTTNYLTADYAVNAIQGQDVTILLTATDLKGMNSSKFIVTYDPNVLELSDLNATTQDQELSVGNIPDTDINIIELAPGTIQFTLNTSVEKGESFSGLVDSIKFVAKKDGQSTITYSIVNTSNAYLRSLESSSGKLSPDFTDTTLAYNLKVKSDVTSITFTPTAENPEAVIKINGVEVTNGQTSAPIGLKMEDNIVTVEVTAADDGTVNKYTITVTRDGGAYLTGLDLSSGTLDPIFNKTQDTYKVKVDKDTTSITLTPTAEATDSVIKVNGVEVASGQASAPIDLKVGDNTITVEVTAADGPVKTYTITVTREGGAYLTGLDLSTGSLDPVFDKAKNNYTINVGYDVSSMTLTPATDQPDAVIKVNGVEVTSGQASGPIDLNVGDNTITIGVSTSDGTVNTYTITVTRDNGAYLTGLDLSTGTLDPVFSEKQITYSVDVGNEVSSITVNPTAKYPSAVIKVNGVDVISGQASGPIGLQEGNNVISVEVTAADGRVSTYTITVVKAVNTANEGAIQIELIN